MRRQSWAADQDFKKAIYVPKPKKKKIEKNITYDSKGNKKGILRMDRQNLKKVETKRRKILTKGEKREAGEIIGHSKIQDQFAQ